MTTHWGSTGSDSDSSEVGYARFPVRDEVSQVPNPRWGMVPNPRLAHSRFQCWCAVCQFISLRFLFFSPSLFVSLFFLTWSFMIIVQLVKYVSIVVLHQAAMLGLAIPVR